MYQYHLTETPRQTKYKTLRLRECGDWRQTLCSTQVSFGWHPYTFLSVPKDQGPVTDNIKNNNNNNCCGATEGSEQQHNQDLKEIYEERRILEFITFYHNALHLTTLFTTMHCIFNQSALRHEQLK